MKINMVSSVNMCNNKQYNKSQPAFGKFSVEMEIPSPQVLDEVLRRKEFSELVNAADKAGFDIVLREGKDTDSRYTLIAQEREVKSGRSTCKLLWENAKLSSLAYGPEQRSALTCWYHFIDKRAEVDTLVGQFNERLGLNK